MKCEKCGKYEATTHIRTVANGIVYEKNLCSYCAEAEGLGVTPHNSIDMLFSSLLGEVKPQVTKKCPLCGAAFSTIAESGKVGCAECYDTFREELLPYIKRLHGSTKHIGNTPESVIIQKDTVLELREELRRLITEEKYEQAAIIRDRIKLMEAQTNE